MESGAKVIKVIEGAGFRTGSFNQIESNEDGVIRLKSDSCITYDARTMNEIDPAIPGFRSYLVAFDGQEEDKVDWDKVYLG